MTPIRGENALIFFKVDSGYTPYACATLFTLKVDTEMKSVKTLTSGPWADSAPQINSYGISLSGLIAIDESFGAFDLVEYEAQMVAINFRLIYTDDNNKAKRIEGKALVKGSNLVGPSDGFVTGDFELVGKGEFLRFNNSGVCASVILDASLSTVDPKGVSFSAGVGTAYISYRILKNLAGISAEVSAGTIYAPDFFASFVASGGLGTTYSVEATPFCDNDIAGQLFAKDFSTAQSFIQGKAGADACSGMLQGVYGTIGIGNILYTDAAMTIPLTGYSEGLIAGFGGIIYGINPTTGQLQPTTSRACATPLRSNWYKIGTDTGALCDKMPVRLYTPSGFAVGEMMYYDSGYTSPVLGNSVILNGIEIWNMNPATGVVTSDAGLTCPDSTPTDMQIAVNVCNVTSVIYYLTTAFGVGAIIYTNVARTIRLLGKNKFVRTSTGDIYNINPTTGTIVSDSGVNCP